MSTTIRATISRKNKYWISKHRYYELKHFCLQYPNWKTIYSSLDDMSLSSPKIKHTSNIATIDDRTSKYAMVKVHYSELIKMVEDAAFESDEFLYEYILKAVTEERSYSYLQTKMNIPCSKDVYYDRYRKFFWILNKKRD